MKLLDACERRFGRYAIPNLSQWIVIGQLMGLLLGWLDSGEQANGGVIESWTLYGQKVLAGQWYRLVTMAFVPMELSIWVLLGLYMFWLFGGALEAHWGAFRYNIFLLLGYLGAVGTAFACPEQAVSVGFLGGSVFLAFAFLYPDFQIYLMLVLPVKVKYGAWLIWFVYFLVMVSADTEPINRLLVLAAVANFLVFFGHSILLRMRSGHRKMKQTATDLKERHQPFHRCAVCGMTERDEPQMLFRYCSGCEGDLEYCEEHLESHEHVDDSRESSDE